MSKWLKKLVPPTRIERATRGLGTSPSPTQDNLTPEGTTEETLGTVDAEGPDLSCPGSGEVASSESQME